MKKFVFLLASSLFFSGAFAQNNSQDGDLYPPNAEPGKCYAKCLKPDVFETVTEKVMIEPEKKAYRIIPTTYKTVTEQVKVKDETKRIINIPAVYKTVTEQVLVKPEGQKWVKKKQTGCLSENPDDCIIMCLEKTPAVYKTVTKQVLDKPASTREEVIPAEYKTVTKQVVDVAAHTQEIVTPAEYQTVTKTVLKTKGGYSEWKEIVCDNKVNTDVVSQIQTALKKKGYDIGPKGVDGVLGTDTKAALVKYQKDNNLPVGNLNIETMKSLGVKFD
jgi:hypothetical protein